MFSGHDYQEEAEQRAKIGAPSNSKMCPECHAMGGPDGVTNCATCRGGFWETPQSDAGDSMADPRYVVRKESYPTNPPRLAGWVVWDTMDRKFVSAHRPEAEADAVSECEALNAKVKRD